MAKKLEVEIDVKGNVVESLSNLKKLKQALKEVPAGTAEWNKIKNQIRDVEDSLESAGQASEDFKGLLENAPGPLGALGGAIKKVELATKSWGAALKATGIGLIVGLIGGLVGAFTQTEGSMKKLEPLMIAFEQIMGGIFEALQPLIDGFVELAMNVMPYVTKAFKVVYSAVTAVFQSLGKLGSAVVKLFKGDFKGAWEDAKSSVTSFSDNYEAATERFDAGAKKMTKTQKENLKQQSEDAQKALDEKIKRMEAEDKLDEAKLKKLKEEALALAKTEQEKLDVEKRFAEIAYKARIKDLEDKQKLYKQDSVEYKNLQTEKINAEADYLKEKGGFTEQQKKIDEDNLKAQKDFEQKAKEIREAAIKDETDRAIAQRQAKYDKELAELEADKEFIKKSETEKADLRKALAQGLQNDLDKIRTDARVKELDAQLRIDEARLKALQEGSKEYFDQQRVIENDAYESQKEKAKGNAKELEAIEIQHKAVLKNIDKSELEAKRDLQLQIVNLYGGFGKALQELAGKNKGLAIAGLLVEQAAGIATIIINTQKAAAKAGYFTPLGIATLVAGAASVATAIAATIKGINQIKAVNPSGGGAAGGGQAVAPTYTGAPSALAAPQIQTAQEATPGQQIAQTIGAAQSRPVRAYVVSSDIQTQTALDRRTNRGATFNLG